MSRHRQEPMEYTNADLMDELNEFMIAVKTHLYNLPVNYRKPTVKEIDQLQARIHQVLRQDAKPMRKY